MRCKCQDKISGTKVLVVLRISDTKFMVKPSPLQFTVAGPRQLDDQPKQIPFQRKDEDTVVCMAAGISKRAHAFNCQKATES